MKIKVTNTQTVEIPDDMDPEVAEALFENPGFGAEDDDEYEEDDVEDAEAGEDEG